MARFLHIGTVRRAHGLRGQLKVALDNVESEVLMQVEHVWTGLPTEDALEGSSQLRRWPLSEARPLDQGLYLVTLDGLADRTAAEALAQHGVYADRAEMPALADDEVYQADLVGCAVLTDGSAQAGVNGGVVGVVRAIEPMNGNRLLVIERQGRADALVPLVPQIVTNIDLAARTIRIDPPEGLLDLDRHGPESL